MDEGREGIREEGREGPTTDIEIISDKKIKQ